MTLLAAAAGPVLAAHTPTGQIGAGGLALGLGVTVTLVFLAIWRAAEATLLGPIRRAARLAERIGAGEARGGFALGGGREANALDEALHGMAASLHHRQERMTALAERDPLTGLANRTALLRRGQQVMAARSRGGAVALLFVDLDGFKQVNDTYGHATGDALLRVLASRLRRAVRDRGPLAGTPAGDTIARIGGDEFAILLGDVTARDAAAVAARILHLLCQPFVLSGVELNLAASIGIAEAPRGEGPCFAELLQAADRAMYEAKSAGKATWRLAGAADRDEVSAPRVAPAEVRHSACA